jgi:replicative DNA helicase
MIYQDTSKFLTDGPSEDSEFDSNIEKSIIALAIDHPDIFMSISRFITPDLFESATCKYLIATILNSLEEYQVIPTRNLLHSMVSEHLTVDDPYEEILEVVNSKSDPREVPILKNKLVKWAKKRAYSLVYSDEAMMAYQKGEFDTIDSIIQDAQRITDFQMQGIWLLDNTELLMNPAMVEHRTTGFAALDAALNKGGPSPKEVVCYIAPTNVGKSILLCNNAISSWKGSGPGGRIGQDVLLVTFELDYIKTGLRCLGVLNDNIPIDSLLDSKDIIMPKLQSMKNTYDGRIFISELPPEECSVDHLYNLLDNMKRMHNWKPDVVILDYLDLMISRNKNYNETDYTRQKYVANEIRGFAKNENVLIFTATQTNRSGNSTGESQVANLNSVAESYAKQFSMDYIVSINQSDSERSANPARFRFFIAKNRNGPKHQTITCEVNYSTMKVKQINT